MDAYALRLQRSLPERDRLDFLAAYDSERKDPTTAFLLSLFLGNLGADRFYIGQTTFGVLKLITLGGFFIWGFVDLFLIRKATEKLNREIAQRTSLIFRGTHSDSEDEETGEYPKLPPPTPADRSA